MGTKVFETIFHRRDLIMVVGAWVCGYKGFETIFPRRCDNSGGYVGTEVLKLFSSGRCDNSGGYVGTQVLKLFSSGRCDNSGGSWVQGIQTITNKITITIIR